MAINKPVITATQSIVTIALFCQNIFPLPRMGAIPRCPVLNVGGQAAIRCDGRHKRCNFRDFFDKWRISGPGRELAVPMTRAARRLIGQKNDVAAFRGHVSAREDTGCRGSAATRALAEGQSETGNERRCQDQNEGRRDRQTRYNGDEVQCVDRAFAPKHGPVSCGFGEDPRCHDSNIGLPAALRSDGHHKAVVEFRDGRHR